MCDIANHHHSVASAHLLGIAMYSARTQVIGVNVHLTDSVCQQQPFARGFNSIYVQFDRNGNQSTAYTRTARRAYIG